MEKYQKIPVKAGSNPDYPVNDLIIKRWSPRAFSEKKISKDSLQSLLEAMRWAPSSMNAQPWRIIYAFNGDESFNKISDTLMDSNKIWAPKAPVLLLALVKKTLPNGSENASAKHDLGLAVGNLLTQATSLGIGVHQMGGFSKDQAINALEIPDDYEPNTVIALGYFGEVDNLPDKLRDREKSSRTRNKVEEFAFHGKIEN